MIIIHDRISPYNCIIEDFKDNNIRIEFSKTI